jgi:VWFA-related protein
MKTPVIAALAAVLLTGAVYSQTTSQNPSAPPDQGRGQAPPFVVPIDVVRVTLLVSVADNRGRLVTNLKKEDFRVYEDDRPQTILEFGRETDLPLSIAMLVDSSGSVIDKLKFEQEAAVNFFFNTVKRRKDRAQVVMFDSEVRVLLKDFSDEPETLADAVRKIRAGGGTAAHDAVRDTVKGLLAKEDTERRKLIILIGDGDDTQSRYSQTEALEMAQRNDVTIYAISTNKTSDTRKQDQVRGDDILKKYVEETGGRLYFPLKIQDLDADFAKIGEELRSQYVLFYQPTNSRQDGTYRQIRVEMADGRHKARARKGYYADARAVAAK